MLSSRSFPGALSEEFGWDSFHSAWVNTVVRNLNGRRLPRKVKVLLIP